MSTQLLILSNFLLGTVWLSVTVLLVTCHCLLVTVWLTENLNEVKITHYEKIFSHIKQKFSHFEKGLGINNIFLSH